MALDPLLLEILACPEDKGPLFYFEDEDSLYNPRLKRRYAMRDDIPIMLIDEAETVDRRRARSTDGQGRRRGAHADVQVTLDSLGMHAAALGLPEQVADAAAAVEQGIDGLP